MTLISGKLLATIAGVLAAVLAALAAYTTNVNVSVGPAEEAFGAVPVLSNPLEVDGAKIWASSRPALTSGNPAICTVPGPKSASSTLLEAGGHFSRIGTGGNVMLELGFSSTAGATTTRLFFKDTVANAATSIAPTSTALTTFSVNGVLGIVPPNSYVSFRISTTSGAVGNCSAIFLQI